MEAVAESQDKLGLCEFWGLLYHIALLVYPSADLLPAGDGEPKGAEG